MRSIGIVGGGIGGVAAAAALIKHGCRVTVYERAPQFKEVGAGMMLWPNATRVLKKLDILGEVASRSGASDRFLVRSHSGRILMDIALGNFEVPALCTLRSDLLSSILSLVPEESVRLGHEMTDLEQRDKKVRIHFADGTSAEHDVLIGADGLRSRVRTRLFGPTDPIYRGYVIWRGVASYTGDAIASGHNTESWGQGGRFGILGLGNCRFTWYATANAPKFEPTPVEARKDLLLRHFGGWHDPIPALIGSTEVILENGAFDLPPLSRWTAGRITLLGDAAHPCTPNLGQGGGMALEDGLVLARCLSSGLSIDSALRRYEKLRLQRTRHIQQRSRAMGTIGQWQNGIVVGGRRVITRLLPAALFEHNLRRVYSYET